MRLNLGQSTGVDASRSTPHFDYVLAVSQVLRSPNRGMVADMGAGVNVRRLDALADNTDFISIHCKLIPLGTIPELIRELER